MSRSKSDSGLRANDHACGFYHEDRQLWTTTLRVLRHNLFNYSKCLCVIQSESIPQIEEWLQDNALSAYQRRGQLVLATPEQTFLRHGEFSIEHILNLWDTYTGDAVTEGYRGLCVITNMDWSLRAPAVRPSLETYEAQLNGRFDHVPFSALCLYDQRNFPQDLLLDILQTHPVIFINGEPRDNPYYLPRELFHSKDRCEQFRWYLGRIERAKPEQSGSEEMPFAPSDSWQIYCLGELRLMRDSVPVAWDMAHGATRLVKALFAYLLEQGKQGASKENLTDLLWPEQTNLERSLSRLYHTVHALRTALEPDLTMGDASRYILSDGDRYMLALPPDTWIDAEYFEDICRRGERAFKAGQDDEALRCYLPAEDLYAGDLFSDIPGSCAERLDDDWCWSRRYWLREMYLKLMLHLAEIYLRQNAPAESLHYWHRALKLDPCCEEAHRGMMRAFHRAGRPDALARQYRICERQLRRQENRVPDSQTTALWRTLNEKKRSV